MSCVALLKAMRKKKNMVPWNQNEAFNVKATPPNEAAMSSCMDSTHQRLVL